MLVRLMIALGLVTALAATPAGAAVTMPLLGAVDSVGTGVSGITVGDRLSGSVTWDETDALCPSACLVTDLTLSLPGGVTLGFVDLDGPATVDARSPRSLDAMLDIPGAPYDVGGAIFLAGLFSSGGPRTFEILGDPAGSTFIASGTLGVVPIPAALPLLATALGAMAAVRWRSTNLAPPRSAGCGKDKYITMSFIGQ